EADVDVTGQFEQQVDRTLDLRFVAQLDQRADPVKLEPLEVEVELGNLAVLRKRFCVQVDALVQHRRVVIQLSRQQLRGAQVAMFHGQSPDVSSCALAGQEADTTCEMGNRTQR